MEALDQLECEKPLEGRISIYTCLNDISAQQQAATLRDVRTEVNQRRPALRRAAQHQDLRSESLDVSRNVAELVCRLQRLLVDEGLV